MFDLGCASVTILGYFLYLLTFHASILSAELPNIYFLSSPEPIVAPLGDFVNFRCSLNIPPNEYQWKHNSKLLPHNKSGDSLEVQFLDSKQVGDYQCIVRYSSKMALASTAARLSLSELQPFPPAHETFYSVTPGNTFTIYCPPPVSNPAAVIHYIKNGVTLPPTTPILPTTGSLLLLNVTKKDAGTYSCSATNYFISKSVTSEMQFHINVIEDWQPSKPKFLHEPQSTYVVQSGFNITLECTAVGHPVPKITWQKADGVLPHDRAKVVPGGLVLWDVGLEDAGQYICNVSNGIGSTLSRNITVQVQEPPRVVKGPTLYSEPRVVKSPTQYSEPPRGGKGPTQDVIRPPEEGGELTLTCDVKGTPEPTIKWLLNSEPLDSDPTVKISGNVLKIPNVGKNHAGVYQCFATNPVGSVFGATMVNVSPKEVGASKSEFEKEESATKLPRNSGGRGKHNGRKSHRRGNGKNSKKQGMVQPTKPNVTRLTNTSVMVQWSMPWSPDNKTNLHVEFFRVQHTSNLSGNESSSKKIWSTIGEISNHTRAWEVGNLEPNQDYKFRIATVYNNDDNVVGPVTKPFRLLASNEPIPNAPEVINTEPDSNSSIKIQWKYNASQSVPIEGFFVYYAVTNRAGAEYQIIQVLGENTQEFVISNLEADTSYDIKMRSFTTNAASQFSNFRSQKTKKKYTTVVQDDHSDEENNPVEKPPVHEPYNKLYLSIGIAVGGFGLLILTCFLCCCFRRQSSSSSDEDGTESCSKIGDNALTIQQLEPVTMNGYANHNGKILNGRTPQRNGFCHAMTITNNPLAESEQSKNVMELSYLSSQNNNCSAEGSSN